MVGLLFLAICGTIAAVIAHNKGRSAVGWFFAGFFFHVIGIIIVSVVSNLKAERAYRERVESENRRLREQIRQEHVKSETFRQYSVGRLDAHDKALGMDTRQLAAGADGAGLAQLGWLEGDVKPPSPLAAQWYYEREGETRGPVPAKDISMLLQFEEITPHTLVWSEGMSGWTPLHTVPGLRQQQPS